MGPFHAVMTATGACAWVGDNPEPVEWPAGWSVRFAGRPALIDPAGHVVGHEGDFLTGEGGMSGELATANAQCGPTGEAIFFLGPMITVKTH